MVWVCVIKMKMKDQKTRRSKRLSLSDEIIQNAKAKTARKEQTPIRTPTASRLNATIPYTPIGVNHRGPKFELSYEDNDSQIDAFPGLTPLRNTNAADFYGLPDTVRRLLKENRGIESLYDWQERCLKCDALRERRNLILSLPTSGGKTLIAEILLMQEIILRKRDVLLVLPFVSIVQEKIKSLIPFGLELGFLVEEYAAAKGRIPPTRRRKKSSVYVATIEKAQGLLNSLIENGQIEKLGLVIVDELHMLGESGRGASLEQSLTKLLLAAPHSQIVGMSATLSNIQDLLKFLDADLFTSDFRPVELKEMVKIGPYLYEMDLKTKDPEKTMKLMKQIPASTNTEDPDCLKTLVEEVIPDSSCMIFCSTKKGCENVAVMLSKLLAKDLKKVKVKEKVELLKTLHEEGESTLCPVLNRCIPYGIAYHHSGLTTEERKLIQDAYLEGTLCIICCTSTLAAGVNLPAKRVILRSPMVGAQLLNLQQYKQMSGRAGRAGLDAFGESIVILQPQNKTQFLREVTKGFRPCFSTLQEDNAKGIRTLLLSLIALKLIKTRADVKKLKTLFQVQANIKDMQKENIGSKITETESHCFYHVEFIDQLIEQEMVKETKEGLEVSQLGRAAYKGPIDCELVPKLLTNLRKPIENGLILSTHLHLLHCVIPYDLMDGVKINWGLFYKEFRSLNENERKVVQVEGFGEQELVRRLSRVTLSSQDECVTGVRTYLSLMLNCLWKKQRVWDVATRFDVPRGWLQNLLQSSAAFASCLGRFSEHIPELWGYKTLFPDFVKQLTYCVQMELIPLMDIQGVKQARARQLYNAGYKSVADVADASAKKIMTEVEHLSCKQARQLIANAKMLRQEEFAAHLDQIEILFMGDKNNTNANQAIVEKVAEELL